MVLTADFLLEFRFEYLWPFWLLLRSAYDSFKYQGLVSFKKFKPCFCRFLPLIGLLSDPRVAIITAVFTEIYSKCFDSSSSLFSGYVFQAFSLLFLTLAFCSDLICLMFLPVHWLFFAASTYVWVQYVWHTGKLLDMLSARILTALSVVVVENVDH